MNSQSGRFDHFLVILVFVFSICAVRCQRPEKKFELPESRDSSCAPGEFMRTVSKCPARGLRVIYDAIKSKFPEGCMKPYPQEFIDALVAMDTSAVLTDPDVRDSLSKLQTATTSNPVSQSVDAVQSGDGIPDDDREKVKRFADVQAEKPSQKSTGDEVTKRQMSHDRPALLEIFGKMEDLIKGCMTSTGRNVFSKESYTTKRSKRQMPSMGPPVEFCPYLNEFKVKKFEVVKELGNVLRTFSLNGSIWAESINCTAGTIELTKECESAYENFLKKASRDYVVRTLRPIIDNISLSFLRERFRSDMDAALAGCYISSWGECSCRDKTIKPCITVLSMVAANNSSSPSDLLRFIKFLDYHFFPFVFSQDDLEKAWLTEGLNVTNEIMENNQAKIRVFLHQSILEASTAFVLLEAFGLTNCESAYQRYLLGLKAQLMADAKRNSTYNSRYPTAAENVYNSQSSGNSDMMGLFSSFLTTDLLSILPLVPDILRKKLINDEQLCVKGQNMTLPQALMSPNVSDLLLSLNPMLAYLKNAFIRKHSTPGKPFYSMMNSWVNDWMGFDYLSDPRFSTSSWIPEIMATFCSFSTEVRSCVDEAMKSSGKTKCGQRWNKLGPWMDSLLKGMCTEEKSQLVPNQKTADVLTQNYGYIFNFMGCFLHKNGSLPLLDPSDEKFNQIYQTVYKAKAVCNLQMFGLDYMKKLTAFTTSAMEKSVDILTVAKFMDDLAGSASSPIRCVAKQFHSMCASSGVDLGTVVSQFLPMISLATYGVLNMPPDIANFRKAKKFNDGERVTVMVIGDPHVKSYKNKAAYQTCDGLEYFAKVGSQTGGNYEKRQTDSPMTAADSLVLLSNEYFFISGRLARWSAEVNGSYLNEVNVTVHELPMFDGNSNPAETSIKYSYNSESTKKAPYFIRISKEGNEEIVNSSTVTIDSDDRKVKLSLSNKEVEGEKRMILTESNTGTIIAFSNPMSDMVNVYVRSSSALFDISQGLLIEGCPDTVNRTESIRQIASSPKSRMRRAAASCQTICQSAGDLTDLCLYDCTTAVEAVVEVNVTNTYADVAATVDNVVELPSVDEQLMEFAAMEVEPTVITMTPPSLADLDASGGATPAPIAFEKLMEAAGPVTAPVTGPATVADQATTTPSGIILPASGAAEVNLLIPYLIMLLFAFIQLN